MVDGQEVLREAIRTIPIPGSPPKFSHDAAMVGLAFLDAGLRQNHVRRLTERLELTRHGIGSRITELDISLSLLSQEQRTASELFQRIRVRSEPEEQPIPSVPSAIWLPVSRLSRRAASPIEVTGADGSRLPRLTQYETSRFLVAAMVSLLRGILRGLPDARTNSELGKFLHSVDEARWLLQSAIATSLLQRSTPRRPIPTVAPTSSTVAGHGAQYRAMTFGILSKYEPELREFMALLDVAVREYLLVVALDSVHDEHILRYTSPLTTDPIRSKIHHPRELIQPKSTDYHVLYKTQIPATLRSYHLAVQTSGDVSVQGITLVTNAEKRAVDELVVDLRALSGELPNQSEITVSPVRAKLLELELQSTVRRVAELYRRRVWEADSVGLSIEIQHLQNVSRLASIVVRGDATTADDGSVRNSLLHHPDITAKSLLRCAHEIERCELSSDLSIQNEPAIAKAHAYWRRPSHLRPGGALMSFTAAITLRDSGNSRPRGIILYLFGIALMSYLLGSLAIGGLLPSAPPNGPSPGTQDAIVAVLLLVPGFLFTRLDLAPAKSIVGRMRIRPRLAAYSCILLAALEAAVVAGGLGSVALSFIFSLTTLLLLTLSLWLFLSGSATNLPLFVAQDALPRWIARNARITSAGRPDVIFRSSETSPTEEAS